MVYPGLWLTPDCYAESLRPAIQTRIPILSQLFITNRVWFRLLVAAVLCLYLVLAIASTRTKAPWCDEGYFAEPALQLSQGGAMATTAVPPSPIDDPKTQGTDRATYYVMPLNLLLQAGWYKVAGFGILQMRLLSVMWGAVELSALILILRAVRAPDGLIALTLALVGLDYTFIRAASDGRMDLMSAALGLLGIALYLRFRQARLAWAVFTACCCVSAACFTHPIGGLLALIGLSLVAIISDFRRLKIWHVLPAVAPFLIGAAGWGWYISQNSEIFREQFSNISSGRLSAWKQPLHAISREIHERFLGPFGITGPASSPAKRLKAIVLLADWAALLSAAIWFRRVRQYWIPIVLAWAYALALALLEGTKAAAYLVHVVPLYSVLVAIWIWHFRRHRLLMTGVVAALLAVQLAGTVYAIRKDSYRNDYLPAIGFLATHPTPDRRIFGVSELGFGLGFRHGLIDDRRLGFYNGLAADTVVVDRTYRDQWVMYGNERPEIRAYIAGLLSDYRVVFRNSLYTIYQRNESKAMSAVIR